MNGGAGLETEHEQGGVDVFGECFGAQDRLVFAGSGFDAEKFEGHGGIEGLALDADLAFFQVNLNVGKLADGRLCGWRRGRQEGADEQQGGKEATHEATHQEKSMEG
jgi:hypothetical protein